MTVICVLQKSFQVQRLQPCSEIFFVANILSPLLVTPEYKLDENFSGLDTALRTFLCLSATVVSFESNVNKLKRITSYFQASMWQEMLSMNSTFSIETR